MNCYFCNCSVAKGGETKVFNDTFKKTLNNLGQVVCDILDKSYQECDGSAVLCQKCCNYCEEYSDLQTRLRVIKDKLQTEFKQKPTLVSPVKLEVSFNGNTPKNNTVKKIVLPASKLMPLPSNYVINVSNIGAALKSNVFPLKLQPPPSTILQTQVTPKKANNPSDKIEFTSKSLMDDFETSLADLITTDKTANSMPIIDDPLSIPTSAEDSSIKNFLTSVVVSKNGQMKIDEECSYELVQTKDIEGSTAISVKDESSESNQNYFDVSLLSSLGHCGNENFVLGKLQIMDDDNEDNDDDGNTIVIEQPSDVQLSHTLRVVSGNRLVYGDNEISLLSDNDDQNEDPDQADSQDDEESQIELQVSGDEETANAIIAAAQKRGGAFIKVESGEMYRVKSVQSKTKDDEGSDEQEPQAVQLQIKIVEKFGEEFKCLLCEKNGRTIMGSGANIMTHVRTAHHARVYICDVCGHVERRRSDHQGHMMTHIKSDYTVLDKSKTYECNECQRHFSSKGLLLAHIEAHTVKKPFTCQICKKSYANKYTLQSHMNIHTDRPRPYKCTTCNKSFMTPQNLNQHVRTHSAVKDFECNICNKTFATQHSLEVHGIVHSGQKPFACFQCGKGFARKAEVRDHLRTHTGERPFACDVCGATFSQRSNLLSHRRATHLHDRRHHCQLCPKRFKRRRLLEYHIKSCHTGERPLECEVCHATFVYPEHYKKHKRIHNGKKPYPCEVCGKQFSSSDNRNTHRFVHSDKKPYECLVCGAGYMRKQLLYAHMNQSNHMAESIVVNQPRVTKVNDYSVDELETGETPNSVNIGSTLPSTDTVLTLDGLGASLKTENVLEQIDASFDVESQLQLGDESGGAGSMYRLVQIQLPNGTNGWVAINSM